MFSGETFRGSRHLAINPSSYPQCALERKARSLSRFASSGRAGRILVPARIHPSTSEPFLLKGFVHSFFPAPMAAKPSQRDPIRTVLEGALKGRNEEVMEITKSSPWIKTKEETTEGSP